MPCIQRQRRREPIKQRQLLCDVGVEGVPPFGELGIVIEDLRDECFPLCRIIFRRLRNFPKRDEVVCRQNLLLHEKQAFLERLNGDEEFDDFIGNASERFRYGKRWVFWAQV